MSPLTPACHGKLLIMASLIIIRGYPGSGKTTLGKALQSAGCGQFIDHNQILTFIAKITGDDEGIYGEIHSLEQGMVKKLLNQNQDVIVARGFSSCSSLRPYTDIARNAGAHIVIFRLDASQDTLSARVQAPERRNDFNPTITQSALTKWIQDNPLEVYDGEVVIDGNPPLDEVVASALAALNSETGKEKL